MGRIIPLVIVLALMIYALVECLQDDNLERTGLVRGMWVLLIIALPVIGPVGWLVVSRMTRPKPPRRRPLAPDDDPDFLRRL